MKQSYSGPDPPAMIQSVNVGTSQNPDRCPVDVMIDSGAFMTSLPASAVKRLGVKPSGFRNVFGFNQKEPERLPTFVIQLYVGKGSPIEVPVLTSSGELGLLGRDILNRFTLVANGPKKLFKLR